MDGRSSQATGLAEGVRRSRQGAEVKREEICGTFLRERIAFGNGPDDRVAICELRMADGSEATAKGPLREGELQRNLQVRMYGTWRNHHKHGRQFVFTSVVVEEPATEAGTVAYLKLCRGPNGERVGIGQATALNLWAEFGPDAVRMLREDPDAACRDIPRFTKEKARLAAGWLRENHAVERARIDLIGLLDGRGFPRKVPEEAIRTWGSRAAEVIRRNPYHLMRFRGCGFGNTDKMYLDLGHRRDRLKRQALSAWYALARDTNGDTWFPLQQAHGAIHQAVAGADTNVDRATELATRAEILTVVQRDGRSWVAETRKANAERTAAVCIAQALQEDGQWPDVSEIKIGDDDDHQREQLAKAVSGGPIAILCGSPGTGKTHTASALIRKLIMTDGLSKVAVCAPTGKAAVRLNEAMIDAGIKGLQSTTIHSLLRVETADNGWTFLHSASDPLPFRWVVIDEASMIDTGLMTHLLAARAPGTHFLFIGDTNQLPPVGHGAPLRDMIRAGVPCGELREVRRNSGRIVQACAEIRDTGRFTASPRIDLEGGENFVVVRREDPESQVSTLQQVLAKAADGAYGELDPVWDVQVLVAVNDRSPLSRSVLNRSLQGLFNPDGETAPGNPLRVKDKIICLQNGWYPSQDPDAEDVNDEGKLYVANGEQAEVLAVEPARTIARLQAPDRIIIIPHGQQTDDDSDNRGCAGNWDLGYAITTHRSQGSAWPIVVLMIDEHGGARHLMSRNLIYTAISRGKLATIGIGKIETLYDACRKDGISGRKTMLVDQIHDELPDGHPLKPEPKPEPEPPARLSEVRHISSVLEELAAARPELDLSVLTQPAVVG